MELAGSSTLPGTPLAIQCDGPWHPASFHIPGGSPLGLLPSAGAAALTCPPTEFVYRTLSRLFRDHLPRGNAGPPPFPLILAAILGDAWEMSGRVKPSDAELAGWVPEVRPKRSGRQHNPALLVPAGARGVTPQAKSTHPDWGVRRLAAAVVQHTTWNVRPPYSRVQFSQQLSRNVADRLLIVLARQVSERRIRKALHAISDEARKGGTKEVLPAVLSVHDLLLVGAASEPRDGASPPQTPKTALRAHRICCINCLRRTRSAAWHSGSPLAIEVDGTKGYSGVLNDWSLVGSGADQVGSEDTGQASNEWKVYPEDVVRSVAGKRTRVRSFPLPLGPANADEHCSSSLPQLVRVHSESA